MGKRKNNPPKHFDESKRQLLTWNMNDPGTSSNGVIHGDVPNEADKDNEVCSVQKVLTTSHSFGDVQEILEEGDFSLTISNHNMSKSIKPKVHIGNIKLKLCNADEVDENKIKQLQECEEFHLCISINNTTHTLICETKDSSKNQNVSSSVKECLKFTFETDFPSTYFELLKIKALEVTVVKLEIDNMSLLVEVHVFENALTKLQFSSEAKRMQKIDKCLQKLISFWYQIEIPDDYDNENALFIKKHDIEDVFLAVKNHHSNQNYDVGINVQHQNLKPKLREYQRSAVKWMLTKEKAHMRTSPQSGAMLHPYYKSITAFDGAQLYFNPHFGYLTAEKPVHVATPPGGILGDEMGLGKTVEVLACILCHPRSGLEPVKSLPAVASKELGKSAKNGRRSKSSKPNLLVSKKRNNSFSSQDHSYCLLTENGDTKLNGSVSNDIHLSGENNITKETFENIETISAVSINGDKDGACETNVESSCDSFDSGETIVTNNVKLRRKVARTKRQSKYKRSDDHLNALHSQNPDSHTTDNRVMRHQETSYPFGCICGHDEDVTYQETNTAIVQCRKCHVLQHSKCVNYDFSDSLRGLYLCPHCHILSDPIKSGATLIVTPSSISHQWVDEILKHIIEETLNVLVYEGVHKQGYVQPQILANQDIVITTYETLRKEIHYVDLPHSNCRNGRKFRRPKRYMATPSPLVAVEWWRICLDEAQMVECTSTKTAEMALRLSTVNRWCVTGTPIQKNLEDVYGLFLFLGVDPFWVHAWWKNILYHPFCYGKKTKLLQVLASVMWRNGKKDVIDEICLPMQSESIHSLQFSPVEEHFYRRQFQACSNDAMHRLRKFTDDSLKLNNLDKHTLHQLLLPLTKLRQACCHPQAVKGEFLPIHKTTMTMEELLNQLTKKAKMECEEAHRMYVAAGNGLAALHIVKENYLEAINLYRDLLRSVDEHKTQLRTDELQQLHTMHNLNEILQLKPEGVNPTLRDSQLKDQCSEISTKYMQKAENFVVAAHEAWVQAKKTIAEVRVDFNYGYTWWADTVHYSARVGYDGHLLQKVKEDLSNNATAGTNSIIRKFKDYKGLLYIISSHLDELQVNHEGLVTALHKLQDAYKDRTIVTKTVDCCLRPSADETSRCPFCEVDEMFTKYEVKLFCFTEKGVSVQFDNDATSNHEVHTKRQGTWADSEVEKALKAILSFAKSWGAEIELIGFGNLHMQLFDALKKEFRAMRTVWIETKAQVGAVDELDMATTRIRIRLPDEPVSDPPQPNVIEKVELEQTMLKNISDQMIAKNSLRKKLGQLLYLTNLSKTQSGLESGKNPEVCPICQRELGFRWSVLLCGHCFCMECIRLMIDRYRFGDTYGSMKCPVCRQKTRHAEIAFVSTKKLPGPDENIKIKGDHSTKVEGVVRCLLEIHEKDSSAKSLVFSTWHDVLEVLSKALNDNDISYRWLQSKKFCENLESFKCERNIQVLLLPIHSGSNGLNIIEATHVLFVEPILNAAQELQAIGRVYRIGQTKPTFVHRFVVKGTIEEKIHQLLQNTDVDTAMNSYNTKETTFTIGDFKALLSECEIMDADEDESLENGNAMDIQQQPCSSHAEGLNSEIAGNIIEDSIVGQNVPSDNCVVNREPISNGENSNGNVAD